ncbi:hypothetical protein DFP72DRAFT_844878 [Ephemerocybe angulata]|uniref:Uncharacterized protein n=1 Tax=Ephemerocybe angulata TaxID=980116 RepID=A0A8H6I4I4_9AGAR|nr:hypothetical protein DFP72DRAFT_844878 [Tulosesus angulatus]
MKENQASIHSKQEMKMVSSNYLIHKLHTRSNRDRRKGFTTALPQQGPVTHTRTLREKAWGRMPRGEERGSRREQEEGYARREQIVGEGRTRDDVGRSFGGKESGRKGGREVGRRDG